MSTITDTYTLFYDCQELATVEIDKTPETAQLIKEMVEFWMGWERELREANGDYTQCWLKRLAMFILRHGDKPRDEEGWVELDGTKGIMVRHVFSFQFDENEIQIREEVPY